MIVTATEFKAKCLHFLDQVKQTGERIQVTKRGKVVAELGPVTPEKREYAGPGFAKDYLRITGDIMEPIDVEWEAMK